jgi:hypothetical protein
MRLGRHLSAVWGRCGGGRRRHVRLSARLYGGGFPVPIMVLTA